MRLAPLLLFIVAGIAQAAPALTVQSLPYQGKDQYGRPFNAGAISMAWVAGGASPAARQINDFLFLELFSTPAPKRVGKVLTAKDGLDLGIVAKHQFTVYRNDERILSIEFSAEVCNEFCSDVSRAYSFDSQSGRALSAEDLFTQAGKAALARQFNAKRRETYSKELTGLEAELAAAKAAPANEETQHLLESKTALKRECLENVTEYAAEPDVDAAAAHFADSHHVLDKAGLFIHAGSCFRRTGRASDDVGVVDMTVPYQALAPHLTPYGLALLLAQGKAPAPEHVFGHLLYGHVGDKAAVTMLLQKNEDYGVRGYYYDAQDRTPVELSGTFRDGVLKLRETIGDNPAVRARLTLRPQGSRLAGTWAGTSELTVDVGP